MTRSDILLQLKMDPCYVSFLDSKKKAMNLIGGPRREEGETCVHTDFFFPFINGLKVSPPGEKCQYSTSA